MLAPRANILRYEDFIRAATLVHQVRSLRKVRVTGGEPLVRRNLPSFIGQLRRHFPDTELTMTTNGIALADAAEALKRAGLSRVNVSLDALDAKGFARSTGSPDPGPVIQGIDAALAAGLKPVKVNCVLQRSVNLDHLPDLVAFAAGRHCEIRFIELMAIGPARDLVAQEFVPMAEALDSLRRRWPDVEPLPGGENSRRFRVGTDRGSAVAGFITPVSHPFCESCDRLRLDAQGRLHACLRQGARVDLGPLLRSGADEHPGLRLVRDLVEGKAEPGSRWAERTRMFSMGG